MAKITANLKERLKTISSYLDGGTFTLKKIGINPKNQEDISAVLDPSKGKKLTAKQQKDIDKIRAINLEENQIEHPGFLQKILGARPKISAINLRQNPINAQGFSSFAEFLKTNTSLKTVAFSTYKIGSGALNKGLKTIFAPEEGESNTTLTRLEINRGKDSKLPINNKSKIRIETLEHCAPGMKHLRTLVLSNCIYRPKSNENLNNFIHGKYQKLTKDEANVLAKALKTMQLEWLSLSNNAIGDDGIKIIAEGLIEGIETVEGSELNTQNTLQQKLQPLRVLYLDNIKVTYTGASHIAKCLANTNLQRLHLNNNTIGDKGIKALAESLVSSKLSVLELRNNKITDQGVQHLAKALKSNPNLIEVDLRGKKNKGITIKGANTLHEALKNNTTITRLDLTNPYRKGSTKHKTMQGIIGKITDHLNTNKRNNAEKPEDYITQLNKHIEASAKATAASKATTLEQQRLWEQKETKEAEFKKDIKENFEKFMTGLQTETDGKIATTENEMLLNYLKSQIEAKENYIKKLKWDIERDEEKLEDENSKRRKRAERITRIKTRIQDQTKTRIEEEKKLRLLKDDQKEYTDLKQAKLAPNPLKEISEQNIKDRDDALKKLKRKKLGKENDLIHLQERLEAVERIWISEEEENKKENTASQERIADAKEKAAEAKKAAEEAKTATTTAATAAEEKVTQLTETLKEIEKSQESEIEKATKALNDFITKYNKEHPKQTPKSFPDTYILLQQQLKAADAAKKRIEEEKRKDKTLSKKFRGFISNTKSRAKNWGKLPEADKDGQSLLKAQLEEEIELLNNIKTAQKPIEDQKVLIQAQKKIIAAQKEAEKILEKKSLAHKEAEAQLSKVEETEQQQQLFLEKSRKANQEKYETNKRTLESSKKEENRALRGIEAEIQSVEEHLKDARVLRHAQELQDLEVDKRKLNEELTEIKNKIEVTEQQISAIDPQALPVVPEATDNSTLEIVENAAQDVIEDLAGEIPAGKAKVAFNKFKSVFSGKKQNQQKISEKDKLIEQSLKELEKLEKQKEDVQNKLIGNEEKIKIKTEVDLEKQIAARAHQEGDEKHNKERETFYKRADVAAIRIYQEELFKQLNIALNGAYNIKDGNIPVKNSEEAKLAIKFIDFIKDELPGGFGAKTAINFLSGTISAIDKNIIIKRAQIVFDTLVKEENVTDITKEIGYRLATLEKKKGTYFKKGLAKKHAKIIIKAIHKKEAERDIKKDSKPIDFCRELVITIIEKEQPTNKEDTRKKDKGKNKGVLSRLFRKGAQQPAAILPTSAPDKLNDSQNSNIPSGLNASNQRNNTSYAYREDDFRTIHNGGFLGDRFKNGLEVCCPFHYTRIKNVIKNASKAEPQLCIYNTKEGSPCFAFIVVVNNEGTKTILYRNYLGKEKIEGRLTQIIDQIDSKVEIRVNNKVKTYIDKEKQEDKALSTILALHDAEVMAKGITEDPESFIEKFSEMPAEDFCTREKATADRKNKYPQLYDKGKESPAKTQAKSVEKPEKQWALNFIKELKNEKCCLEGSFESGDLKLGLQDGNLLLTIDGNEYDYELNPTEEGLSLIIKGEAYELQLSVNTEGIVIAKSSGQEGITINTQILNSKEKPTVNGKDTDTRDNAFNHLDDFGYEYQASDMGLIQSGGYLKGFSVIFSDAENLGRPISQENALTRLDQMLTEATGGSPSLCIYNKGRNHWVSVIIADVDGQKVVLYKDSMGGDIDPDLRGLLTARGIHPENIKVNRNAEQTGDYSHCGIMALENLSRMTGGLMGNSAAFVEGFEEEKTIFCPLESIEEIKGAKALRGSNYEELYFKGVVAQMQKEKQTPSTAAGVIEYLYDTLNLAHNPSKAVQDRFVTLVAEALASDVLTAHLTKAGDTTVIDKAFVRTTLKALIEGPRNVTQGEVTNPRDVSMEAFTQVQNPVSTGLKPDIESAVDQKLESMYSSLSNDPTLRKLDEENRTILQKSLKTVVLAAASRDTKFRDAFLKSNSNTLGGHLKDAIKAEIKGPVTLLTMDEEFVKAVVQNLSKRLVAQPLRKSQRKRPSSAQLSMV